MIWLEAVTIVVGGFLVYIISDVSAKLIEGLEMRIREKDKVIADLYQRLIAHSDRPEMAYPVPEHTVGKVVYMDEAREVEIERGDS